MPDPARWPNQIYAVSAVGEAVAAGHRKILVTGPTGSGKSTIMLDLATACLERDEPCVLYSNRRTLIAQISKTMLKGALDHGIRMAGHADERHLPFQIASFQTEESRVLRKKRQELHPAKLALIDEAHVNGGKTCQEIIRRHVEAGATVVGFTATPVDLGHIYEHLIVAGTVSEMRKCGALVPCIHYGPDEPDLKGLGKLILGKDLTEKQAIKAVMRQGVFGRVLESFHQINPTRRPTILFAPGVKESINFAEEFERNGIKAAHIDGDQIWMGGEFYESSDAMRQRVFDLARIGEITVLTCRYVLREGIDLPFVSHVIFATVFGSLQSYIQSGGRVLRAHPGKKEATCQDHGGNWIHWGSLNADREWHLDYTGTMVAGARIERMREKIDREPCRCPQCSMILAGRICRCGYEIKTRSRPVVQSDGKLVEYRGDIFSPRVTKVEPDTASKWKSMYYRAKNGGMTFRQAEALFAKDHGYYPPRTLPLMPTSSYDLFRRVKDVPRHRLTQE
jgi:DNA repair protein RadD